jgi:hypothetical protein
VTPAAKFRDRLNFSLLTPIPSHHRRLEFFASSTALAPMRGCPGPRLNQVIEQIKLSNTAAARRKQRAPGMPRLFATDHGLVARAAIAPP